MAAAAGAKATTNLRQRFWSQTDENGALVATAEENKSNHGRDCCGNAVATGGRPVLHEAMGLPELTPNFKVPSFRKNAFADTLKSLRTSRAT